jgi:hypothetical protein
MRLTPHGTKRDQPVVEEVPVVLAEPVIENLPIKRRRKTK